MPTPCRRWRGRDRAIAQAGHSAGVDRASHADRRAARPGQVVDHFHAAHRTPPRLPKRARIARRQRRVDGFEQLDERGEVVLAAHRTHVHVHRRGAPGRRHASGRRHEPEVAATWRASRARAAGRVEGRISVSMSRASEAVKVVMSRVYLSRFAWPPSPSVGSAHERQRSWKPFGPAEP